MSTPAWLLLLYGLPARNGAARVRLWRKLQKTGALSLKTSAYLLPDGPAPRELFQWLAQQIWDAGGEATLVRAAAIEGLEHDQLVQLFHEARAQDYRALIVELNRVIARTRGRTAADPGPEIVRLRRTLEDLERIDYFGCPLAQDARALMERAARRDDARPARATVLRRADFQAKVWLTRPRPQLDRVASAWLIRKFIDPRARFVFASSPRGHPGAIPFDLADVEFTHHGDDCTFETLLRRFALADRGLRRIAEMVHNADLNDGKFAATEGDGIDRMLRGLARQGWTDERILQHGFVSLDALYAHLKGPRL